MSVRSQRSLDRLAVSGQGSLSGLSNDVRRRELLLRYTLSSERRD